MAELKVGLAANRTSYFDPNTNTYITLQKPVQKVSYNEEDIPGTVDRLDKITHALLASVPALVLYEGNLPQECIDAFEAKYKKMFHTPTSRNIVENGKVIGSVPYADPVRNNIDYTGRPIEPNRAFDRGDKVNGASADVVAEGTEQVELINEADLQSASTSEAEQVELLSEEPQVEEAQAEAKEEKKSTRKKTTTKSEK